MDYQFVHRVEDAQNHVECDPGERKPARPVMAQEQKYSANNRNKLGEFRRHSIRLTSQQPAKMSSKPERANRQI
jgi:hypothetical protein